MSRSIRILAALAVVALCAACAGTPTAGTSPIPAVVNVDGTPTAATVAAIQTACTIDAGLRPVVDVLILVPNLATAGEQAAVPAARALIDPICADPSAPIQATMVQQFKAAAMQLVVIEQALQARKAAKAKASAPAPAASSASSPS